MNWDLINCLSSFYPNDRHLVKFLCAIGILFAFVSDTGVPHVSLPHWDIIEITLWILGALFSVAINDKVEYSDGSDVN